MAVRNEQNALSTTAEVIITPPAGGGRYIVKNIDAAIIVYLGDSSVSSSNGMSLAAGASTPILELFPDDVMYAVAASGTPTIAILKLGV